MIGAFFLEETFLRYEGEALLLEEFGKDYGPYFSIRSLIASGKNSRGDIESVLQREIGGHLQRLEVDYQLIRAMRFMFSKPASRNIRFVLASQPAT